MSESEVIQLIKSALCEHGYGNDKFQFIQERRLSTYQPDLIIKAGEQNIAAIEIKNERIIKNAIPKFTPDLYLLLKIRFFIYTDGKSFYIFDRFENPKECKSVTINDFVRMVSSPPDESLLYNLKTSSIKIILEKITESNIQSIKALLREKYPHVIDRMQKLSLDHVIEKELKLSSDYVLYFEHESIDSFEHLLFTSLLNSDNDIPEYIYRYCPLNRAFHILNDNIIAMHGLLSMNDKTEPNYVDNYINDSYSEPWNMPPQCRTHINRRFIMSCTTLHDTLLQWRLYGDDGKGACLKFKPIKTESHRFYLGKVKYADKNGEHPELILIKSIISEIKETLFFDIKFIFLYSWRHFFKPREYDYEQEVRLLYIHHETDREKKWIITEPYNIVNPMVIMNLNELPLKLTEVMLGSKCPEKSLNKSQLEQMISEKKGNVSITESDQKVYR